MAQIYTERPFIGVSPAFENRGCNLPSTLEMEGQEHHKNMLHGLGFESVRAVFLNTGPFWQIWHFFVFSHANITL